MNPPRPTIRQALAEYWKREAAHVGWFSATTALLSKLWGFLRDSTPSRLRRRYGDADFDWVHHVNTTSAAVGWRDRLLGVFYSPYQPTDSALFQEMMRRLEQLGVSFSDYTFLDLGSGKGRALIMASDYSFRRILGVELLPSLHQVAQENLNRYKSGSQRRFAIEAVCADATVFPLPPNPLLIYLFNPFPEAGLRHFLVNLGQSLRQHPRAIYLLYHNPLLEHVLLESTFLGKIGGTHQYSIFFADFSLLRDAATAKNPG